VFVARREAGSSCLDLFFLQKKENLMFLKSLATGALAIGLAVGGLSAFAATASAASVDAAYIGAGAEI
jgi:hypothetical protein